MNALIITLTLAAALLLLGAIALTVAWTIGDRRRTDGLTALAEAVTDTRGRAL